MLDDILAFMGFGSKEQAASAFARESSTLAPSPSPSENLSNGCCLVRRRTRTDVGHRRHAASGTSWLTDLPAARGCARVREDQILALVERYDIELGGGG